MKFKQLLSFKKLFKTTFWGTTEVYVKLYLVCSSAMTFTVRDAAIYTRWNSSNPKLVKYHNCKDLSANYIWPKVCTHNTQHTRHNTHTVL